MTKNKREARMAMMKARDIPVIFVAPDGTAILPIIGGKGGSSGTPVTTTSTQNKDPWSGQQPFLTKGFEESERLLEGQTPTYFPGSTVVPYSPETETALGIKTAQALDPGSLINAAGDETGRTLRGEYLKPENPLFRGMMKGVSGVVRPQVDSGFARAGRFGSPLHAEALSRGITTGMLPFVEGERGRMGQAVERAYPVSQYAPGLLGQVGGARETLGRENLQEDIDRHNFEQNVEAMKLKQFMENISGNYGGTTTGQVTQPTFRNPLMEGLGAASSAVGIGSGLFGGPDGEGIFRGTYVCTAYHDLGYVHNDWFVGDHAYGEYLREHDPMIMIGYDSWGRPLAKMIRRHKWLAWILWPLVKPIIREISARGGCGLFGSLIGKFILRIGLPLCRWIGQLRYQQRSLGDCVEPNEHRL